MFIHSDSNKMKKRKVEFRSSFLVFIFLFCFFTSGKSQPFPVNIIINVVPPYTSKVNEYMSQPNKIMVTLINTSSAPVNIYLGGTITGEGGIKIYTDPSSKTQMIRLSAKIPYQLNIGNIQQLFDMNHVMLQNINKNELIYGNGLPEGDYRICLRAYDYQTSEPVSPDDPSGCSNTFTVTDVEPPVILQPVCDQEVIPKTPQNVIFTWTRPPGTPINTRYDLKVIEVLPSDRNINDAIKSAVHPVFFESMIPVNSCLLGPADPQLVEGKKYAFTVTVIDPSNKTSYRNKGMSEACSFIYRNPDFSLALAQVKILTPEDQAKLSKTEPASFLWLPPFTETSNKEILYQLKIVEVTHAESKNTAINRTEYVLLQKGIQGTSFTYPEKEKPLESGKIYAWQVTAFSGSTEIGGSDVRTFSIE